MTHIILPEEINNEPNTEPTRSALAIKEDAILDLDINLGCGTALNVRQLYKEGFSVLYGNSELDGALHKYAGILKESQQVSLRHDDYNLNKLYFDREQINSIQLITGKLSKKKFGIPFEAPSRLQAVFNERKKPSWHYLVDIDIEVELREENAKVVDEIINLYRN